MKTSLKRLAPLLLLAGLPAALALESQRPSDVVARAERLRLEAEAIAFARVGGGDGDASDEGEDDGAGDVATSYFDQRLDHFSSPPSSSSDGDGEENGEEAGETFRQRYFYTSRYVGSGGEADADDRNVVAFLCVGGEGPSLTSRSLVDSVHCTGDMIGLAEELHGKGWDVHLFALEHRYYGESFPSKESARLGLRGEGSGRDDSPASARTLDRTHLSSRQAVRDVASFVRSDEALKHLTPPGADPASAKEAKWIAFGGSYPGMLSAWSHLLRPDAIFAAVSNSAPIEAKLDFEEYNARVGADLEDADVGGGAECRRIVDEGHAQVAAALERAEGMDAREDGLDELAEALNLCNGADWLRESRRNKEMLVGDGLIRIPAQGNDPACTKSELCNIEKLCNEIANERKSNPDKTSMEILAHVKGIQLDGACDNAIAWEPFLNWWKTPTQFNANDISWLYQTCSEFGFYQTCNEDSNCPYGKGFHDISRDLEICQAVFGIDPDTVKKNVQSTLAYYGGLDLTPDAGARVGPGAAAGTRLDEEGDEADALDGQKRIVFATGTVDPWTALSLTIGNDDHPSVSVRGASHHFWTHKVQESDGEHVAEARRTIYDTVSAWLGVPPQRLSADLGQEAAIVDKE